MLTGVHLKFQNSTGEEDTYTAKVVIGADGNQSNVRECVLKDGPPNFLNTVVWRGQTSTPDDWPHDDNLLTGWGHEGKLFLAVKMVNKLAWQAYAPLAAEDLKTLSTGRYCVSTCFCSPQQDCRDLCLIRVQFEYEWYSMYLLLYGTLC